jgi:uncharacterized Ntn-hydrolase superfamily protein
MKISVLFLLLIILQSATAQNLPSLVTEKNINSTFSILAYDDKAQEWGIAVATNNLYVGNSTIYLQPGVGAVSVIAETEPDYGINGLEQLKQGKTPQQAIELTLKNDPFSLHRQLGILDKQGRAYAYTGSGLKYWKGSSSHLVGNKYIVMGNQLADGVLEQMAKTFENNTGTLAQRLLQSLQAGQQAGGQINGKQSSALVVKGISQAWYNQIDLRVDHSKTPFEDLQRLLDYHYGRSKLNEAISQLKNGNKEKGKTLLLEGEKLVAGWTGIYSKLVLAYLLLEDNQKAIAIIERAVKEEPAWKNNLAAFYCLSSEAAYGKLIKVDGFDEKDWNSAIQVYLAMGKNANAIELALKTIQKYPTSSYTHYLLGQAYINIADKTKAKMSLQKALELDQDNQEARKALASM